MNPNWRKIAGFHNEPCRRPGCKQPIQAKCPECKRAFCVECDKGKAEKCFQCEGKGK